MRAMLFNRSNRNDHRGRFFQPVFQFAVCEFSEEYSRRFHHRNRSHPLERAPAERSYSDWAAVVKTTIFGVKETDHRRLNDNLGTTSDPATKVSLEFVEPCLA